MRILHVAEAFATGILETVRVLAAGTASAGHEVVVAHGRRPETPADLLAEMDPRVELVALPWTARTARAQLSAARALRKLIRGWHPDVVHLHSSFAGLIGTLVIDGSVPTVFSPHSYASARADRGVVVSRCLDAFERAIARRASLVGAVSRSEGALARRYVPATRVVVVENGIVELDDGAPLTRPRGEPWVVSAGRPEPQHDPAGTARILTSVSDVARVTWIGGQCTPVRNQGEATLTAAGVTMTGWLPRAEVMQLLAQVSVLLHWSSWDGLPLVVLEAMAQDALVIARDVPPSRDLVGPDQTCSGEAEASALVRRALLEPELAESLLHAQRRRRRRFGAQRMIEGWLHVYEQLLRHAPRSDRSGQSPVDDPECRPAESREGG